MLRLRHFITADVTPRAFLMAGSIMAVAVAGREAIELTVPGTPPFITLYPAVIVTALLCGPWAAGISTLLALIAAIYFWIPPDFSFHVWSRANSLTVTVFTGATGIVLWATAEFRAVLNATEVAGHFLNLGLAAGGVGTWQYHLRTAQITASPTALALHNLPESDGPDSWLRNVPPEDAETVTTALRDAVENGTQAAYTYRVLNGPEGPRWITARGKLVSLGSERWLLCALLDITGQMQIQDELRLEREHLRLALEAGALAVWDFDPATGLVTIDTNYAVTIGLPADVRTMTLEEMGTHIHAEDLPRVGAAHEAQVAAGAGYQIEYRMLTSNGLRWVCSQGNILKDSLTSQPGRMVGIIQDITERKQREEQLLALASMREMLIREADHRIKNSLQMVMALLTVQMRGITDPAAIAALREAITRVGAIAASHLALQSSQDFVTVNLAVTLKDLCAHFSALQPAINMVCKPSEALMLDADRAIPLGLVVSELITNALRHAFRGRETGTVTMEASADAHTLTVRVSDDGVGMNGQATSAGLGSRIIRSLINQLSATMEVASVPGGGTTVTLHVPLQAPMARAVG
jgi:two-component sensor histidine kinase/PAS domain-containing protein